MYRFITNSKASLVWNTMVLMTVFLPLASLVFDVPQYFAAAANLEMALDAAAQEAANDCLQLLSYSQSGTTSLDSSCVASQARRRFQVLTDPMAAAGHVPNLTMVTCSNACRTLHLQGATTIRVLFSLSPPITIIRSSNSQVRMTAGAGIP